MFNIKEGALYKQQKKIMKTILRKVLLGKVHELVITQTKNGNYVVKRDGKSLDKCSISEYFKPCTYFSIYWYTCNKNAMIEALMDENNDNIYK